MSSYTDSVIIANQRDFHLTMYEQYLKDGNNEMANSHYAEAIGLQELLDNIHEPAAKVLLHWQADLILQQFLS